MNKPGDVQMIFGRPHKADYPIDQAKLIKHMRDSGSLEEWTVEYLNEEGKFYNVFIMKDNGTS